MFLDSTIFMFRDIRDILQRFTCWTHNIMYVIYILLRNIFKYSHLSFVVRERKI